MKDKLSCVSGLENRDYSRRGSAALTMRHPSNPQKLTPTSPTSGGRSLGIFRSRTKATELVCTFTRREGTSGIAKETRNNVNSYITKICGQCRHFSSFRSQRKQITMNHRAVFVWLKSFWAVWRTRSQSRCQLNSNKCNLSWPRYCYHSGLGLADKTVWTCEHSDVHTWLTASHRQMGLNSQVSHGNCPDALMYGTRDTAVARSRVPSSASGRTLLNPMAL
jgi:hypothetical protein